MKITRKSRVAVIVTAIITLNVLNGTAQDSSLREDYTELKETVEELTQKLDALQTDLAEAETKADAASQQVAQLKPTQRELGNAAAGDSAYHIAGYTDAGFFAVEGEDGNFATGLFAPIFHYQYKDVALLEAELEPVMHL